MPYSKPAYSCHALTDLPNISIVLAEALRGAGVKTPQLLCDVGAEHAWCLLRDKGVRACIQSLLALEGAIVGVNWQSVPNNRRQELMRFASQQLG